MDIKDVIYALVEAGEYEISQHCLIEMDKDGISIDQVENTILEGKIAKRKPEEKRYTYKWNHLMCCLEIISRDNNYYITVITAGRERR